MQFALPHFQMQMEAAIARFQPAPHSFSGAPQFQGIASHLQPSELHDIPNLSLELFAPAHQVLSGPPPKIQDEEPEQPALRRTSASDSDLDALLPAHQRGRPARRAAARPHRDESTSEDEALRDNEVPLTERAARGTATKERRRHQNRMAQRALRERKEAHVRALEVKTAEQQKRIDMLVAENASLREANAQIARRFQADTRSVTGMPAFAMPNPPRALRTTSADSSTSWPSDSSARLPTPPTAATMPMQPLVVTHDFEGQPDIMSLLTQLKGGEGYDDSPIWYD